MVEGDASEVILQSGSKIFEEDTTSDDVETENPEQGIPVAEDPEEDITSDDAETENSARAPDDSGMEDHEDDGVTEDTDTGEISQSLSSAATVSKSSGRLNACGPL